MIETTTDLIAELEKQEDKTLIRVYNVYNGDLERVELRTEVMVKAIARKFSVPKNQYKQLPEFRTYLWTESEYREALKQTHRWEIQSRDRVSVLIIEGE